MLKKQDDGGNRKLRRKGRDQSRVDIGGSDVFESSRNGAQNLDGIFAFGVGPVTAVEPCGESNNDDHKSVP